MSPRLENQFPRLVRLILDPESPSLLNNEPIKELGLLHALFTIFSDSLFGLLDGCNLITLAYAAIKGVMFSHDMSERSCSYMWSWVSGGFFYS